MVNTNSKKNPGKIPIFKENIPKELRKEKTFCCWQWKWTGKKFSKPPCDIHGNIGNHLEMNFTLKEVLKAYEKQDSIAGIGFSLRDSDFFCGVDIDDCVNDKGKINKAAKKIIKKCGSYTEISPSGKGVRILGFGKPKTRGGNDGFEVYNHGRYLTITGNIIENRPFVKIKNPFGKIEKELSKTKKDSRLLPDSIKTADSTLLAKLVWIDPDIEYNSWYSICQGIHDYFDGSEEGLNLFLRWSKGGLSKKGFSNKFDEEECLKKYEGIPGRKRDKRTIKTIDYFYKQSRPKATVIIKEKNLSGKKFSFPVEPYSGLPGLAQNLYSEFNNQSAEPIPIYLYMATEAVLQYLVGNRILTPSFGRTTSIPMLGAGISTGGKDLNSSIVLNSLRKQLIDSLDEQNTGILTQVSDIGFSSGTYTSATSFLQQIISKNLKFWTDTEASQILKILADTRNNIHGGQTLVIALNELYDGHFISGKNLTKLKIVGVSYPQLPILWLTQIESFAGIITHDLLHVGFLGRLEYFFDTERRVEKSSFSPEFQEKPFGKKLLKTIIKFLKYMADFKQRKAEFNPAARNLLLEWEEGTILNQGYDENRLKFFRRIGMTAEKRLTVYAMFQAFQDKQSNKSPIIINTGLVEHHFKMMDYQFKMRKRIYDEEIAGNDLYEDIKKIYLKGDRDKQGFMKWVPFYQSFKNKYKSKYPQFMFADPFRRELNSLAEMNFIDFGELDDKRGTFIKCLVIKKR